MPLTVHPPQVTFITSLTFLGKLLIHIQWRYFLPSESAAARWGKKPTHCTSETSSALSKHPTSLLLLSPPWGSKKKKQKVGLALAARRLISPSYKQPQPSAGLISRLSSSFPTPLCCLGEHKCNSGAALKKTCRTLFLRCCPAH